MKTCLRAFLLITAAASAALGWIPGSPSVQAQGGPTVRITAPSNGAAVANPVTVAVVTSGAVIKDAAANDPTAAHLHYFIDRDPVTVLQPGQPIPSGQADIIHTPDTSQVLPSLSPGPHNVWVVLAHTDHTPYSPNVQDRVSFTIGGAPAPAAASAGAPAATAAPTLPPGGSGGLLPLAGSGERPLSAMVQSAETNPAFKVMLSITVAGALTLAGIVLLRRSRRHVDVLR